MDRLQVVRGIGVVVHGIVFFGLTGLVAFFTWQEGEFPFDFSGDDSFIEITISIIIIFSMIFLCLFLIDFIKGSNDVAPWEDVLDSIEKADTVKVGGGQENADRLKRVFCSMMIPCSFLYFIIGLLIGVYFIEWSSFKSIDYRIIISLVIALVFLVSGIILFYYYVVTKNNDHDEYDKSFNGIFAVHRVRKVDLLGFALGDAILELMEENFFYEKDYSLVSKENENQLVFRVENNKLFNAQIHRFTYSVDDHNLHVKSKFNLRWFPGMFLFLVFGFGMIFQFGQNYNLWLKCLIAGVIVVASGFGIGYLGLVDAAKTIERELFVRLKIMMRRKGYKVGY